MGAAPEDDAVGSVRVRDADDRLRHIPSLNEAFCTFQAQLTRRYNRRSETEFGFLSQQWKT